MLRHSGIVLLVPFIAYTTCYGTTQDEKYFSGPNIALDASASQLPEDYCEWRVFPRKCYGAELAIDGDDNSNFDHGSCSHTKPQSSQNASLKIKFNGQYYITGIKIFNRIPPAYFAERLYRFKVIGYTDNNEQVTIYDDSLQQRQQYNQHIIRIQWDGVEMFSSVVIAVPRRDNVILTLCEVQIFSASCQAVDIPVNGSGYIVSNTGKSDGQRNTAGTVIQFVCNEGYTLNGPASIQCLHSGNYNTTDRPTCIQTECPHFVVTNPLTISTLERYTIGNRISFSCGNGFILQGPEIITCLRNQTWSADIPHCAKRCPFPNDLDNGQFDIKMSHLCSAKDIHKLYTSCQVEPRCNKDYALASYEIRTCQASGMWSQLKSECKKKKCTLSDLPNGNYIFLNQSKIEHNQIYYGETITFNCNNGYRPKQIYNRTCLSGAYLSGVNPMCIEVICKYNDLQPVLNGFYIRENGESFTSGSVIYSEKVHVVCKKGYNVSSGLRYRICTADGIFNGRHAVCKVITCTALSSDQFIKYDPSFGVVSRVDYNTTVTVSCEKGIIVKGSRYKRCNESGLWQGDPVICASLCDTPSVENGKLQNGNETLLQQYQEGASLYLYCNYGFQAKGTQISFTCLKNHTWDGQPSCIALSEAEEQSSNDSAVIGGVTSTVVLALLVICVFAVFLYRRRQSRLQRKSQTPSRYAGVIDSSAEHDYEQMNTFDNDSNFIQETIASHVYNNTEVGQTAMSCVDSSVSLHSDRAYYTFTDENRLPKTAIRVKDLSDLVFTGDRLKKDIEKHFKNLPQGMTAPHSVALKLQNKGKNRYKNLYAYDDTRVILEKEEESQSDYINACYVHGFNKTRKYIASQGPTLETLDDFWKMIWQETCSKIVMLTNLIEDEKRKCVRYWPAEGSFTYGRITVTLKSTESFSQFVIRTLLIKKDNLHSKTITQFHFTAWPDKGVPKYASSLVHFLTKVKYASVEGTGPVIVHCSAGVGRTGTFIALDNLTDQGKNLGYVDVAGMVASLRTQRVCLVQTMEQYLFLHHALVESLMLSTSALPASQFPEAFNELLQMDSERKQTKLCIEFETLKKMSPVAEEYQYVLSKQVRNKQKNRYSNVLPVEEFMPALSSTSSDRPKDANYINAVFIPSYKEQKAFIITQAPLESTKEDFWRLVWEHDIHTIVMMNNKQEIMETEVYWPNENKRATFGNIVVLNDGCEEISQHHMLSLTITKHLVTRYIKIMQCVGWQPRKSIPDSQEVILSLMEIVQVWQQQSGNHTILVHCLNGADKSGLYCVISAVIERMKIEQDVAITQVIEEMRNAREQIIPSVEQYKFCHEAVLAFMNQYETYSNFSAIYISFHIECDKYPKASSNSKITSLSDGNYIGSIILFTCDRGYKMFGSRNITCLNNRQWNTKPPRCDPVKCERPVDFVNGYYTVNTTAPCENSSLENLHYPCEIIAHCNTGYVLRDSKTMYCDDTGVWSLPKPTCDEIQCQYPGPFPHGNYTFFQRYAALIKRVKYGTKISVNCDIGYSYSGPKSRTCGIDGNWSGNAPACTIITCSLPRNITNGNYIFQNLSRVSDVKAIEYGVSVFIKCNNGYRNTGPRYQTCTSNMTWSGGPASCTVIKCEHPEDETVKNVFYILKTGDNFTYGNANISESITVVCRTGFTLSSGSSTRTCLSNGTWSDQDIECSAVTCPIPKQSGDVTNLTSFNKPYNSTIRVLCHRGILRGQAIQRCNEQGKWDGDMPVCETLESEIHTSSNGPVIGAASGTVAVLLLTGLVIALLVYRKRFRNVTLYFVTSLFILANCERNAGNGDNVKIPKSNGIYSNTSVEQPGQAYYSFDATKSIPKTAIMVPLLSDLVLPGDVERERFRKEFENLPRGMTKKHSEAMKLQNRGKNKYKNLYAYDETRVVLKKNSRHNSDYINASFVHGFSEVKAYIASQGPTKETIEDFWRMIWQEKCSKIVMLTNLIEESKKKCEQYWPGSGSKTYGDIKVSMKKSELFSEFVIRDLSMKKDDSAEKRVTQFHFTAWPDKGVPKYASSLVKFRNKVKYAPCFETGPTVVHCSAGIGRTGTFIALDYLTDQAMALNYIDVAGTVQALREQRVNMVQTFEQYIFVHHALVETLMLPTSALPASRFPTTYKDLLEIDEKIQRRKIDLEFAILRTMSPVSEESQYVSANVVRNRQKNRYLDILPIDEYMPQLTLDERQDSNYVNAVFLPSYKEKKAFMITQTPLETTKGDFWRLVWEHNIQTIVMMNDLEEMMDAEIYWPAKRDKLTYGNIDIVHDVTDDSNRHKVLSLTVKKKQITRHIKHIQFGGWKLQHNLPESPVDMLSLMELVQGWQQQTGNSTVLVHCMNGASKSGLYCVILAVIERMKIEQDVAISQVVEEMRNSREQIIPSVDQYQFCHEAVLAFMTQYDTYSNFSE
ncbi:uncharacterized protein LOC123524141 [Mercenaria mercenaria]|uniref:uncharacterized protein LOC123524141 n=1 Tax=Mercenaria mercenaria TaxID=6596 RepID=UPI00234F73AD|nr:uncharacterized protein LOC123524141 [Mercenaria mercenaria]